VRQQIFRSRPRRKLNAQEIYIRLVTIFLIIIMYTVYIGLQETRLKLQVKLRNAQKCSRTKKATTPTSRLNADIVNIHSVRIKMAHFVFVII